MCTPWHFLPTGSHLYCFMEVTPSCQRRGCNKGIPWGHSFSALGSMTSSLLWDHNSEFFISMMGLWVHGSLDEICLDLAFIESKAQLLGLVLNHTKSEVICVDKDVESSILSAFPTLHPTDPSHAVLLGSPIGGMEATEDILSTKITDLQRLGERLLLLEAHDSLCSGVRFPSQSSCTSLGLLLAFCHPC